MRWTLALVLLTQSGLMCSHDAPGYVWLRPEGVGTRAIMLDDALDDTTRVCGVVRPEEAPTLEVCITVADVREVFLSRVE